MEKQNKHALFLVAVVSTFLKLIPRFSVAGMFPNDESNLIHYVVWLIDHNGVSANALHLPHLELYIIFAIHKLTGIDGVQLCYYINPLLCGVSEKV